MLSSVIELKINAVRSNRESVVSPRVQDMLRGPSPGISDGVPLGNLVQASFLRRDNRFRVQVELDGQEIPAHLPNSGRLTELLTRGRRVWLRPALPSARKNSPI